MTYDLLLQEIRITRYYLKGIEPLYFAIENNKVSILFEQIQKQYSIKSDKLFSYVLNSFILIALQQTKEIHDILLLLFFLTNAGNLNLTPYLIMVQE